MKFRNYCVLVLGNTDNIEPEIINIAEGKPNMLDAKGVVIATFSSVAEPSELTDYFKLNGRNFLLFDLNKENSGFHITKKEIHKGLFGFLNEMDDELLKQKSEELLHEITSTTVVNSVKIEPEVVKIMIEDIDKLSPTEKMNLMNELIDSGVDKLSEYDKKILKKLAT